MILCEVGGREGGEREENMVDKIRPLFKSTLEVVTMPCSPAVAQ